ncbi:hypothetical protein BKA82DRAFT_4364956 [Pisolithus tinctorius]|nr:hypothetical protein BKA82DRAFT_4364956 [Pisolithus tinctorius]
MSDQYITTESRENKHPCTPTHSGATRPPKRSQLPTPDQEPSAMHNTMSPHIAPPPMALPPQPAVPPPPLPSTVPSITQTEPLLHVPPTQIAAPATEITPCPPNGFPMPQLCDQVTRGLDDSLLTTWTNKPGPKAWIRPWRAKFEPNAEVTWLKLKALVQRVIGQEASTSLVISTPQEDGNFQYRTQPTTVISTPEITAFTLPFIQPIPTYICTLENFTLLDSPESNAIVANVIKQAMKSNDVILEFICGFDPDPDMLPTMINSIQVTSLHIANNVT